MKLGVIVLTNQESAGMFSSVTYRILDNYMDNYMHAPGVDWLKAFDDLTK
jgi:hypothetical protein